MRFSNQISYRQADYEDFVEQEANADKGFGLILSCEWTFEQQELGDEKWKGKIGVIWIDEEGSFPVGDLTFEPQGMDDVVEEFKGIIESLEWQRESGKYEWDFESHLGYEGAVVDNGDELRDHIIQFANTKGIHHKVMENTKNKWANIWKLRFFD